MTWLEFFGLAAGGGLAVIAAGAAGVCFIAFALRGFDREWL